MQNISHTSDTMNFMEAQTASLAADPLKPVGCKVGSPWTGPVCPAHPTDAQLN